MSHLGIDLGTSNTLVARINSDGKPEIIEIDGEKMVPSVIYIEEMAANPFVGRAALDMWADPGNDPERSFLRWKPKMGEGCVIRTMSTGDGHTGEMAVTPEKLTTMMVEHVTRTIAKGDDGQVIDSVLVTVPHGWRRGKSEKCRATRLAAGMARLEGQPLQVQEITVSEPVAAAAYWLWVTGENGLMADLAGKTMMVCDVGGGTFDISLVLVGGHDKPLDVVDAINNDLAGDFSDALICAWVCEKFNQTFGTDYPTVAEQILEHVSGEGQSWIRAWFTCVRTGLKEKLCERIEQVTSRGKGLDSVRSIGEDFHDPRGNHLKINFGVQELVSCLEPFYEQSRNLVRNFLGGVRKRNPELLPYAIVFAGGGSRLHGLGNMVLVPVLRELYGSEREIQDVLGRIAPNRGRLDHAIALGAALIANRVVTVQERLLHDIGMIGNLEPRLVAKLGLPNGTSDIVVSPLLARGVLLPARISSSELGLPCAIESGEELSLDLVIDDDLSNPWVQNWLVPHPGHGTRQGINWMMEADADGALTFNIQPRSGREIVVEGRLERQRVGQASVLFGNPEARSSPMPRVRPENIRDAWSKMGGEK